MMHSSQSVSFTYLYDHDIINLCLISGQLLQGIRLYTGNKGNKVICVPPYELFHGFVMFHSLPKCNKLIYLG